MHLYHHVSAAGGGTDRPLCRRRSTTASPAIFPRPIRRRGAAFPWGIRKEGAHCKSHGRGGGQHQQGGAGEGDRAHRGLVPWCRGVRGEPCHRGRFAAWANRHATGSGTGSNAITVTIPATAAAAANQPIGVASLYDSSSGIVYPCHAILSSTSVVQLWSTSTDSTGVVLGVSVFTAGLASGDGLQATITYEAAS